MSGDRHQAHLPLVIRREADIQLGLGVLALVAAATGTWWLLHGRLHPSVWLGVAGALTLAATFFSEGCRARDEYAQARHPDAPATTLRLADAGTTQQGETVIHRRSLLGFMVFGIIASVGGPGVNVLLRILTRGGAGTLDLLAWVLFTLPIVLAVWMLPPRGLGTTNTQEMALEALRARETKGRITLRREALERLRERPQKGHRNGPRPKITDEELIALSGQGLSFIQIASLKGMGRVSVWKRLARLKARGILVPLS